MDRVIEIPRREYVSGFVRDRWTIRETLQLLGSNQPVDPSLDADASAGAIHYWKKMSMIVNFTFQSYGETNCTVFTLSSVSLFNHCSQI
jgi:hypothetical protein